MASRLDWWMNLNPGIRAKSASKYKASIERLSRARIRGENAFESLDVVLCHLDMIVEDDPIDPLRTGPRCQRARILPGVI